MINDSTLHICALWWGVGSDCVMKGLKIWSDITCSQLVDILHQRQNISLYSFEIRLNDITEYQ